MTFTLDRFDLDAFVASTLAEDLGEIGDITSAAVIPADAMFSGVMDSRDDVVVAGLPLAEAFFRALDPDVEIEALVRDGDHRSEEHTSELQSLMRISYAVFCLKQKRYNKLLSHYT